jgi:phosphosulfolactate synthase (CoM biosynthesis protein A)
MQRLKSQSARFHGLIGKLKMDKDEKKALVSQVSAGRATSSKDLTAHEMQTAIDMLSGNYDSRVAKMQAKVRAIAQDLGLLKIVGEKADYTALNTFIERTFKAPNLFKLDYNQLRDCITALERWRDGKTKKMVNNCLNAV